MGLLPSKRVSPTDYVTLDHSCGIQKQKLNGEVEREGEFHGPDDVGHRDPSLVLGDRRAIGETHELGDLGLGEAEVLPLVEDAVGADCVLLRSHGVFWIYPRDIVLLLGKTREKGKFVKDDKERHETVDNSNPTP